MELIKKFFANKYCLAAMAAVIALVVYILTCCPTIYLEDSAEFATAAYTLGIPHPPGFPLYVILGKLFTLIIPFGEIAFRVNLMSAFFGAATIFFLFLLIERIAKNKVAAFSASLIFAFSRIFWSQSVVAEVYTLNTFFIAVLLYLAVLWQEKRQKNLLQYFALIYGLSLTNHFYMMGLLGPIFAIYFLVVDKNIIKDWRLLLKMFLLFLIGLSLYLFLPIRSMSDPYMDWGNTENLHNFWDYLTYKDYPGGGLGFNFDEQKAFFAVSFWQRIAQNFSVVLAPLSLIGFAYLYLKKKKKALSLILILVFLLVNSVFRTFISKTDWNRINEDLFRVFDIPAFLIISIYLGLAFAFFHNLLKKKIKSLSLIFSVVVLLLPIYFIFDNYQINDRRTFNLNYQYAKKTLNSLEENAIFIYSLKGDSQSFGLLYLQQVEGVRQDVDIMGTAHFPLLPEMLAMGKVKKSGPLPIEVSKSKVLGIEYNKSIENLLKKLLNTVLISVVQDDGLVYRPIYTAGVVDEIGTEEEPINIFSRSNGLVYKVFYSQEEAKAAESWQPLELAINPDWYLDPHFANTVIARNQYSLASYYYERGNSDQGQEYLLKGISNDFTNFSTDYLMTVHHINRVQKDRQEK